MPVLDRPLAYRLHVGQRLTFDSGPTTDPGTMRTRAEAWVLADNPDGSWRVAVFQILSRRNPGGNWPDFAVFDLYADGRAGVVFRGDSVDPATWFPPLPSSSDGPDGRPFVDSSGDAARVRRQDDADPGRVEVVVEHDRPYDRLFPQERGGAARFDLTAAHIVGRVATPTEAAVALTATSDLSRTQLRDVCADVTLTTRTLAACRAADHAWDGRGDPASFALIDAAMDALRTDSFQRFWTAYRISRSNASAQQRDLCARRTALVGRPAVEFSARDLAGVEHRLRDYRGQTVVLDFWTRSCPPCMLLTPRLARRLEGHEGVVLLNMSMDEGPEQAAEVVRALGLTSPVLRAVAVGDALQVDQWPTVFVIGPDGVVRDVFVGYSAETEQEILRTVADVVGRVGP